MFKVGDIVKSSYGISYGMTGIVAGLVEEHRNPKYNLYAVDFGKAFKDGWGCNGLVPLGTGWQIRELDLELVENKFKIGDKVVPHAKTVKGYTTADVKTDDKWKTALSRGQNFLYVVDITNGVLEQMGVPTLVLNHYNEAGVGNFFNMSDVTLYKEPVKEEVKGSDVMEKTAKQKAQEKFGFTYGDRVTVSGDVIGTIIGFNDLKLAAVEYDKHIKGHSGNNFNDIFTGKKIVGKEGHVWYETITNLKKVGDVKMEKKMVGFKVGDIVTGVEGNGYGYTNRYATMEVVEVNPDGVMMEVKILTHEKYPSEIGCTYNVKQDKFKLVKEAYIMKVKDTVKLVKDVTLDNGFAILKGTEGVVNCVSCGMIEVKFTKPSVTYCVNADALTVTKKYDDCSGIDYRETEVLTEFDARFMYDESGKITDGKTKLIDRNWTYIFKGRRITAIVEIDGKEFVGEANCDENDKYLKNRGKELATVRARKAYFSWKEKEIMSRV